MNQTLSFIEGLAWNNSNLMNLLLLYLLIFCRWLIMSITIPYLGAALLPSIVRVAIAAVLSTISFLMLATKSIVLPSTDIPFICALFFKEALIGFILGFLSSLLFYAYEICGEMIDYARSASMARLLIPHLKHQSSSMGTLLFQLSLTLFFSFGLHRHMIDGLYRSFERFPVFSLSIELNQPEIFSATLKIMGTLFELAFSLSLPVIFICFLIDIAFGFMNRIAPQINAYFLSLPAKMLMGITIFFFIIPLIVDEFMSHHVKVNSLYDLVINKS